MFEELGNFLSFLMSHYVNSFLPEFGFYSTWSFTLLDGELAVMETAYLSPVCYVLPSIHITWLSKNSINILRFQWFSCIGNFCSDTFYFFMTLISWFIPSRFYLDHLCVDSLIRFSCLFFMDSSFSYLVQWIKIFHLEQYYFFASCYRIIN